MAFEPALNPGMFVRAIVIHDDMQLHLAREFLIDPFEKLEKLLVAMTGVALSDHFALRHFQRREQGRRAIPFVIVSHGSATALLQG